MSEEKQDKGGFFQNLLIAYRWPVIILLAVLIPFFSFLYFLKKFTGELKDVGNSWGTNAAVAARSVVEGVGNIASKFRTETITTTFTSAIPTLTSEMNLEVARATTVETFTRSDEKRIGWDYIYLGKNEVNIKVPVTYRYHVKLTDPWKLQVVGNTCIVQAPKIRPTQPPGIYTHLMEIQTESGWARFDSEKTKDEVFKSMTPILEGYAGDDKHISFVRERCRKQVAEFVKTWLLKEDHWREDRFHTVIVVFEDEVFTELKPSESQPPAPSEKK